MSFLDPRLPDRFWSKCIPEPNTGCWLWFATQNRNGYSQLRVNQRLRMSHRVSYEALVGPIPEGLELDHRCRTTCCVNPAHLEPVTHRENTLRGRTVASQFASRTHCKNGHEFTPQNTSLHHGRTTSRRCLTCHRESTRERRR